MTTPHTDADNAFAVFRRSGDADALGVVYDALAPGLLRLALKLLGDASAAEDVLQATFVTAIESASRHDGERPVGPWFAGILANEVRAHRRRVARAVDPARLAPQREPSDPAQDAIDAELDGVVGRHVRELPDAWQQPVLLRVRQGLTVPEIAAALDRPAGTIRGQIARGLARLRAGLASALGALVLARLAHRMEWTEGGRPSVAARNVVSLGGAVMGVSVVTLMVWGVAAVFGGGVGEEESVTTTSPVVQVEAEPVIVEPLAVDTPQPVMLAAAPLVETRADQPRDLPARIVVVDGSGIPVAGASIDVYASREAYDAYDAELTTHTTDGAGVWEGALERGGVFVARSKHWRTGAFFAFATMTRLDRVVGLSEVVTLRGRVVDAEGEAVAGCKVRVSRSGGSAGVEGNPRRPQAVTSGLDGRFAVAVDAGDYALQARHGERASVTVVVATRDAPDEVTLNIPGDWRLRGTVVDPSGQPVTGTVRVYPVAELSMEESFGVGSHPQILRADTDVEGRFDVLLQALGTYRVVASAPGHSPSSLVDVNVSREMLSARVELVLNEDVSIAGRVVDVEGGPVADAFVSVGSQGSSSAFVANVLAPSHRDLFGSSSTRTNADGRFVLEGLSPKGHYDLTVTTRTRPVAVAFVTSGVRGGANGLVLVDEGEARTTHIAGRVIEDATGEVVQTFTVHVERKRGDTSTLSKHNVDDPDGRFLVDGLDIDGSFAISIVPVKAKHDVGPLGHEFPIERRDLAAIDLPFQRLDPAGETFDVRLLATGTVDITLLDAKGAPRAYTYVRLGQTERVRLGVHVTRRGRTDERGRLSFPSVPPRVYEAIVDDVVYDKIDVRAGETITVVLAPDDEEDN